MTSDSHSRSDKLDEILAAWLRAVENGENPSRDELLARHPDLAAELRDFFADHDRIDRLAQPLYEPTLASPAIVAADRIRYFGDYEVLEEIARGGMGVVFKARQMTLNRIVAIKMILSGQFASPADVERFHTEAEAAAKLDHPGIVPIYEVGKHDGQHYFSMGFVDGQSLSTRVAKGPLPAREAVELVRTVAESVQYAHEKGVIHRDLKPGNILLDRHGQPRVTDFGLAKLTESVSDLTGTGQILGTPEYIPPEQAAAQASAVGHLSDIYSLGAILYCLLTGRPPFKAATPLETLLQVQSQEPVSPRDLNPAIPLDLNTMVLKCLHKEPHKRYASAQALADDLRRFERGEPIKARPVGLFERAVRWVRRRPGLAGAVALGLLLASALVATVFRRHAEQTMHRAEAVAYAEADLSESQRLLDREELKASAAVLQRAKDRLGEYVSPDLRDRLSMAIGNLELVTRLDAIRLERALVKPPVETLSVLVLPMTEAVNATPSGRHYEEAFRDAGIGAPGDNPVEVAARVRNSPVRRALMAALDDWIACAADGDQQAWVLAVLRQADPDPWRDRVRNPVTWDDPLALGDLAAHVRLAEQSPRLLTVLGARLRAKNIDAVPFLSRVTAAYPNDFWANIELGNAFLDQASVVEAIESYRAALELRPGTNSIHYALGCMYLGLHRWDRCITKFEQCIRLGPDNAWHHNRLGVALQWIGGHDDEAIAQFRESIRLDLNIGWTHHHLAVSLERQGLFEKAAVEFQEAARLYPEKLPEKRGEWMRDMRRILMKLGRGAEVRAAWNEELAAHPIAHEDWYGYAELCLFLRDEAEYRRARRELLTHFGTTTDPNIAERVGRASLLLPGTEDELRQAASLTDRAVNAEGSQYDWVRHYFHFAKGLAQYRQGRFDDAIATMSGDASKAAEFMGPSPSLVTAIALWQKGQKDEARKLLAAAILSYDWSGERATTCEPWIAHILRREAEAMIQVDEPAVQENK